MMEFLAEVDQELVTAGSEPVHLVAVGGAAMLTRRASRVTGDIDIVSEGVSDAVRRACEEVAERHGLAPDWINDGAKIKVVSVALTPERIFSGKCLVVDSAGPRYILAMKLLSSRDVDVDDCVHLVRELGISSSNELRDLAVVAVAPRTPPPRVMYWTEEVFKKARRGHLRRTVRAAAARSLARLKHRRRPTMEPAPRSAKILCGVRIGKRKTCRHPQPAVGCPCAAGHIRKS